MHAYGDAEPAGARSAGAGALGEGTAAALQRERNDALERRIGEVEQRLRTGLDEMQATVAEQIAALRVESCSRERASPSPCGTWSAGWPAWSRRQAPKDRWRRMPAQGQAARCGLPRRERRRSGRTRAGDAGAGTRRGRGVQRRHGGLRHAAGGAGELRPSGGGGCAAS